MGEAWRYSWVGDWLSIVWWFALVGVTIGVVPSIRWVVGQIASVLVIHFVWWGSRLIQRYLPYPEDKPEWPGCLLPIAGRCTIAVLNLEISVSELMMVTCGSPPRSLDRTTAVVS